MDNEEVVMRRVTVAALHEILGVPLKVLDDGFVRLVDYMGSDESIVQAARVSYGTGTKRVHEDRGLIRYLMRHRHTTPFEMCELKLHVRVPMDAWRQWIRHRAACLAEGTQLYFDMPSGVRRGACKRLNISIEDIWRRFQPTRNATRPDKQRNPWFKRERVCGLHLRQLNEDTLRFQHTRISNVYRNKRKPVFRMILDDGKVIECTADHRFLFRSGWGSLRQVTGLYEGGGRAVWIHGDHEIYVNGWEIDSPALYQDPAWLDARYNHERLRIEDIASACGVSYHTIRKWLRLHGIQHAKGGRSKAPWNKGRTYRLGERALSPSWVQHNRRARAGSASNFWRGGVSCDRENIGRWTTQIAAKVHKRFSWTCQLCGERRPELHAHHVVPVWADPTRARDFANLTTLCGECHRTIAGRELEYVERLAGPPIRTEWKKRPRVAHNKMTVGRLARIARFEFIGEKETYDLEVEGPYHNFVANGIVTHNSTNEYSTRYSVAIDAAQRTEPGAWRRQTPGNRQGSTGVLGPAEGEALTAREREVQEFARMAYEERLALGVAREQARKDLPLSTYTEAYWKIDLHNLLHFLALRMDAHAQEEIRRYAEVIGHEIVRRWCPIAWEAFLDYRMHALALTRLEREIVAALAAGSPEEAERRAGSFGWLERGEKGLKRNREREEFEEKAVELGLTLPWASERRSKSEVEP